MTAAKQRYEYQPKDDEGRNLGRPQVILYDTQEELIEKLTEQNKLVIKEMRNLKRRNIQGMSEVEEIPETAKRFPKPVEFEQREMTIDEKLLLARDLTDPDKMGAAFEKLATNAFGAAPSQIREAIASTQKKMTDSQVGVEVDYFLATTPDYYVCKENFDTIYNWMMKYDLEPTRDNFALAFQRLTAANILLQSGGTDAPVAVNPVPVEEVAPPSVEVPVVVSEGPDTYVQPAVEAPVVAAEEEHPAYVRLSTGLSGTGTSSGGGANMQPGADIEYIRPAVVEITKTGQTIVKSPAIRYTGYKALDAMSPEEYRNRFNSEPGFKAKVDKMEAERKWNPNQR